MSINLMLHNPFIMEPRCQEIFFFELCWLQITTETAFWKIYTIGRKLTQIFSLFHIYGWGPYYKMRCVLALPFAFHFVSFYVSFLTIVYKQCSEKFEPKTKEKFFLILIFVEMVGKPHREQAKLERWTIETTLHSI